jgi:hypothetical protein
MKLLSLILLALCVTLQAGDLKFEKDIYEANIDLKDTEITREFKFTNTGSKEIKIRHVEPGCSCVTVEFLNGQSTYAAGESGVMRAKFKLDTSQGTIDKPILVYLATDPEDKPSSQVTFRIHIPIAIALEPKTLNWDINSKTETKSIRVTCNYEKPVQITSVSLTSENFSSEIVTVEAGKSYDVRVTPKSTATGALCMIGITTDIELERFRSQQAYARIVKP